MFRLIILLAALSLANWPNLHASLDDRIQVHQEQLLSGNYYFVGNDTGWIEKTKASHGITPILSFKIDEKSVLNRYKIFIYKSSIKDELSAYNYRFSIEVVDVVKNVVVKKVEFVERLLKSEEAKALTAYPFISFEESKKPEIYSYNTLKIERMPYVKINNASKSLTLAKSSNLQEIINYIPIPKTFFQYKWENIHVFGEVE